MTKFIAEVSSNHHRDLDRCLEFVDVSARLNCYAVKFQLFKIEELFAPEIIRDSTDIARRKELELPVDFIPPIYERCAERGIGFSCTPFYLKAVEELFPFVTFYKIASYELMWDALLIECAKTGKPVVLSTGMANLDEIRHGVDTIRAAGCADLTLLHCVSGYPTPLVDCNLAAIQTLRNEFRLSVGWSDHSRYSSVIHRAINRWGAEMIEFHLDLDGMGEEYHIGHCWRPEQIHRVIESQNEFDEAESLADGDGIKEPTPAEIKDRPWRADPSDGLRPLLATRAAWNNGKKEIVVKAFEKGAA